MYKKDEISNLGESSLILILAANIKDRIKYKREKKKKELGKCDYIRTQLT